MPRPRWRPLSDKEWAQLEHLFPKSDRPSGPDRRPVSDLACLDALIWMKQPGEPWKASPAKFACKQTVWRRQLRWKKEGVWRQLVVKVRAVVQLMPPE